jgi:hypothetical protein
MNKQSIGKIAVFIFIAVLLLLIGHFFLHGLEKEHEPCLLCDLLVVGFTSIEQYVLLLLLLFISVIPQIKPARFLFFSQLQIHLRAPPYHSNF